MCVVYVYDYVVYGTGSNGAHLQSFLADDLGAELRRDCDVEPLYRERNGENEALCCVLLNNTS